MRRTATDPITMRIRGKQSFLAHPAMYIGPEIPMKEHVFDVRMLSEGYILSYVKMKNVCLYVVFFSLTMIRAYRKSKLKKKKLS